MKLRRLITLLVKTTLILFRIQNRGAFNFFALSLTIIHQHVWVLRVEKLDRAVPDVGIKTGNVMVKLFFLRLLSLVALFTNGVVRFLIGLLHVR